MKTEELLGTPIIQVWHWASKGWLLWDPKTPQESDLKTLEAGKRYHFNSITPFLLGDIKLKDGWNNLLWEGYPIWFKTGKHLNEAWRDYAFDSLRRVGLLAWLKRNDIREIKAVEGSPPLPPGGDATIWQSTRSILVKDMAWGPPASCFPATLAHETEHMWQADNMRAIDEIGAYTITQLYHTLNEEAIDVFDGKLYTGAKDLLKSTR